MKHIFLAFLLFILPLFYNRLAAQDFEWAKRLGSSTATVSGNKITNDKLDNVITLG